MRAASLDRVTNETNITCQLDLENSSKGKINTHVGMLDHMLELFSFHGEFHLNITAKGDLVVDAHHLIEDVAIVLGLLINKLVAQKPGITRFGSCFLPMDESLVRTVVDLSGRPFHVFKGEFGGNNIGAFPCDMVEHFFYSLAINAKFNLHQEIIYGNNDHHKLEALFKGLGVALKKAWLVKNDKITSTKGVL
ncbi:MAG: imidazoleglycerol-phosphate dehydratase HisB [SAR324 cluster bacterium]|nr:imidazoleglycerol-phosphate dehydratase HisB [SAR324 cluster bacterium]